jgi:hypothetical protein
LTKSMHSLPKPPSRNKNSAAMIGAAMILSSRRPFDPPASRLTAGMIRLTSTKHRSYRKEIVSFG